MPSVTERSATLYSAVTPEKRFIFAIRYSEPVSGDEETDEQNEQAFIDREIMDGIPMEFKIISKVKASSAEMTIHGLCGAESTAHHHATVKWKEPGEDPDTPIVRERSTMSCKEDGCFTASTPGGIHPVYAINERGESFQKSGMTEEEVEALRGERWELHSALGLVSTASVSLTSAEEPASQVHEDLSHAEWQNLYGE
jgi:hypothetical protein